MEASGIYLVAFGWSGNPRGNSGAIEIAAGPAVGTDGTAFVDTQLDGRIFPDTGLLLDPVEVTFLRAIPEPATFMLVLVGITPVALVARRRRLTPHTNL